VLLAELKRLIDSFPDDRRKEAIKILRSVFTLAESHPLLSVSIDDKASFRDQEDSPGKRQRPRKIAQGNVNRTCFRSFARHGRILLAGQIVCFCVRLHSARWRLLLRFSQYGVGSGSPLAAGVEEAIAPQMVTDLDVLRVSAFSIMTNV